MPPTGEWLASFGTPGDGPGQFNTPHSIASDVQDRIYVADRGNRRVQAFDADGHVLQQITIDVPFDPATKPAIGNRPDQNPPVGTPKTQVAGASWTVCITPPPNQVLYVSDAYPGRIYKLSLDGKVLGYLGKSGKMPGEFGWIHQLACPSENQLFVAELLNWRVQKLELKSQRSAIIPAAIRSDRFPRHCEARSAAAIQTRLHGASGLPMPRRMGGSRWRCGCEGVKADGRWYQPGEGVDTWLQPGALASVLATVVPRPSSSRLCD